MAETHKKPPERVQVVTAPGDENFFRNVKRDEIPDGARVIGSAPSTRNTVSIPGVGTDDENFFHHMRAGDDSGARATRKGLEKK